MNVVAFAAAAAVVLLEAGTGRVLLQEGAVNERLAPGSTVKPFVLRAAGGRAAAPERICSRRLRISGRRMDCVHPVPARPLNADEALAYSCNSYFAYLGYKTESNRFVEALRSFGFVFAAPLESPEARQLAALGEHGITTTPLDLARAYARLAATGGEPGLEGAVQFGTAQQAAVEGVAVAGKTGTGRGHAWFAGYAPAAKPRVIVVVLTREGTGGSAAAPEAARILKQWFASH